MQTFTNNLSKQIPIQIQKSRVIAFNVGKDHKSDGYDKNLTSERQGAISPASYYDFKLEKINLPKPSQINISSINYVSNGIYKEYDFKENLLVKCIEEDVNKPENNALEIPTVKIS